MLKNRFDDAVNIRLYARDKSLIFDLAKQEGMLLSDYMRLAVNNFHVRNKDIQQMQERIRAAESKVAAKDAELAKSKETIQPLFDLLLGKSVKDKASGKTVLLKTEEDVLTYFLMAFKTEKAKAASAVQELRKIKAIFQPLTDALLGKAFSMKGIQGKTTLQTEEEVLRFIASNFKIKA